MRFKEFLSEAPKQLLVGPDQIKTSQLGSETSKDGVERYKNKLKNKEELPPLNTVLNKETGTYHLLDGHHRLKAYKAVGISKIPIIVSHEAKNTREVNQLIRALRFG